jgi:hypothetical protein
LQGAFFPGEHCVEMSAHALGGRGRKREAGELRGDGFERDELGAAGGASGKVGADGFGGGGGWERAIVEGFEEAFVLDALAIHGGVRC